MGASSIGHVLRVSGLRAVLVMGLALSLTHCGGGGSSSTAQAASTGPSAQAALGKQIFFDTALSVSGQQSCGTCHVPSRAFSSNDGLGAPMGGASMNLQGYRNAPSLLYAAYIPAFVLASGSPSGGLFRDGRANTLTDQAQQPFITEFEMANASAADVVAKLKTRPYLPQFVAIYGASALDDPDTALARMAAAIAAYESEDASLRPFSSKYDAYTQGKTQLTQQELSGLQLFNNPSKGNCAACHPSVSGDGVTPALFTDFSYDNIGVPRNTALATNSDTDPQSNVVPNSTDGVHSFYDLGLCGPFRDLGGNVSGFCGQFKVPTLRNIALTAPYFHNGKFATLNDALGFYVRRDTNPDEWYPTDADGNVTKFDDLPAAYGGQFVVNINQPGSDANYFGNVNNAEIPYNRVMGDAPALSPDEIVEVAAFLCTLTDGYDPANPAGYALPAQCPQSQ